MNSYHSSFPMAKQCVYWRWKYSELVHVLSMPADMPLTGTTVGNALWSLHRLDSRDCALQLYTESSGDELVALANEDKVRPYSNVVVARTPARLLGPVRLELMSGRKMHA